MENKQCPIQKNIKCLIPVAVVFAVIFVFNWIFHGILMMPQYLATASLWRPEAEMQNYWWVCIVSKLVMASVICCLYCCMAKGSECGGKCPKKGAIFGFKIGLLLGICAWSMYVMLPIPMEMAIYWLVGNILLGVIIGVVLAFLSRMCKKDCKA